MAGLADHPLVGVRSEADGIICAPLRWRERSDRQPNAPEFSSLERLATER
jgi:hypothetical protein